MPVENPLGLIANLDPTLPNDSDVKSEGDNHIRVVKDTLQKQFKNIKATVNASDVELNYLVGVTSNIQSQLDALAFPVGTSMIFVQASPPTGWALDAQKNDRVLRVHSASGGLVGGGWEITGLVLGSHTHTVDITTGPSNGPNSSAGSSSQDYAHDDHTHDVQGVTGINSQANVVSDGTWRPAYVDCVIGVKM